MPTNTDTIVALSTPQGEGAIGVIRLSGSEAIALCDAMFHGKGLAGQPSHTVHFGRIIDEQGKEVDEVLVALFRNPKSYTGEDVCEVSCHGSPYIIQQLLQLFVRQGARLAQPGEFTLRAFLNGKMDLSQAEAVADLIASESASSHTMALRQMRGGISHKIQTLRQELIDFAALIELELDFGEEDVEFADRGKLVALIHEVQRQIRALLQSFDLGNAIKHGVPVAIVGKPNAGKSTLLNALLEEERAIVSDIPGTTRDSIEETLNIAGIQFRFIDTAGIRHSEDAIEKIGIERTFQKISQAQIVIYLYDFNTNTAADTQQDLIRLEEYGIPIICVANKLDAHSKDGSDTRPFEPQYPGMPHLGISALTRAHLDSLKETLLAQIQTHTPGNTIISNARHYDALQGADECLAQALANIQQGISGDFVAMDIRHALRHLGEITGEISSDDLLDSIFGRFCIGK